MIKNDEDTDSIFILKYDNEFFKAKQRHHDKKD